VRDGIAIDELGFVEPEVILLFSRIGVYNCPIIQPCKRLEKYANAKKRSRLCLYRKISTELKSTKFLSGLGLGATTASRCCVSLFIRAVRVTFDRAKSPYHAGIKRNGIIDEW
jgi:hypothetical protein